MKNIFIVTGEVSGDQRGAELFRELKKIRPDLNCFCVGGDELERAGAELIEHIKNMSIVGLLDVIRNLGKIKKQFQKCEQEIIKRKPDAVILIDYPGFNLRLAKFIKKQGIPVIYYIIPQVWAWHESRVEQLREDTDKIIVLFDFEIDFLKKHGINASFAGHPLIDKLPNDNAVIDKDKVKKIALLPGSRNEEVKRLFPAMLETANAIQKRSQEKIIFVINKAINVEPMLYEDTIKKHKKNIELQIVSGDTLEILKECSFAIVTSGTATLETALMQVPHVIVYKSSFLLGAVGYFIVKSHVKYMGIANIILGEEVAPEFLQWNIVPKKMADKIYEIMSSPEKNNYIKNKYKELKNKLGEKGSAQRAAKIVNEFLEQHDKI
ncbi:MAG: lipid-A-disaccharide synthase [Candidatus Omnitrophica bacterium]|nr:lipid-A-disaccharide synthase [Candidatus Omnitrophota bacterium]